MNITELNNSHDLEMEQFNKLKHVYSTIIPICNSWYINTNMNTFKSNFKNYLENQNNELKSDRIILLDNTIKTIDTKEAEILRSYIPEFIYHIGTNKSYTESLIELSNAPKIFYELLNIHYLKEYEQIYNTLEITLKSTLESYWCVIL